MAGMLSDDYASIAKRCQLVPSAPLIHSARLPLCMPQEPEATDDMPAPISKCHAEDRPTAERKRRCSLSPR